VVAITWRELAWLDNNSFLRRLLRAEHARLKVIQLRAHSNLRLNDRRAAVCLPARLRADAALVARWRHRLAILTCDRSFAYTPEHKVALP
jgi:hypothetical protein